MTWPVLSMLALVSLVSCTFDRSSLGQCRTDAECGVGRCVDHICTEVEDTGSPVADAGRDVSTEAGACTPGVASCNENVLELCDDSGMPMTVDCVASCEGPYGCQCAVDRCIANTCPAGQTLCQGNAVVVCNDSGTSATPLDTCTQDETCAGNACLSNSCTPDERRCVGDALVICGSGGVIASVIDCASEGEYCDDTTLFCRPRLCTPGTHRCAPFGETVEVCAVDGLGWESESSCDGTQVCQDGSCVGDVCTPNTVICVDEGTLGTCNTSGSELTPSACGMGRFCDGTQLPAICREGVCAPLSTQCAALGEAVESCALDGGSWGTPTPCNDNQYCGAGRCQTRACTPNQRTCLDADRLQLCDERGAEQTIVECEDDTVCDVTSEPVDCRGEICPPNEAFCDNMGNVSLCDSEGLSATVQSECEFTCSGATCQPAFCGDGLITEGETCDDRNELACDGCDDCQTLTQLVLAPSSSTASGGSWDIDDRDLTLEAWLRVTIVGASSEGGLVGVGDTDSDHARLGIDADGNPYFEIVHGDISNTAFRVTGPALDTSWHHIAGVRLGDPLGEEIGALFVDGQMVALKRHNSVDGGTVQGGDIWIGSDGEITAANVVIDEVHISDGARYQLDFVPPRRTTPDDDTIALYHLDDDLGSTVVDAAGSRNLVLTGHTFVDDDCYGTLVGAECGDGDLAPWEQCDDEGNIGGDSCSADCADEIVCPQNYLLGLRGACYLFGNAATWTAAGNTCENTVGAALLTVEDDVKNSWIDIIRIGIADQLGAFWIGLNDRDTEDTFVWSSGHASLFRAFEAPPTTNASENCVVFNAYSPDWFVDDCTGTHGFVCQFEPSE